MVRAKIAKPPPTHSSGHTPFVHATFSFLAACLTTVSLDLASEILKVPL